MPILFAAPPKLNLRRAALFTLVALAPLAFSAAQELPSPTSAPTSSAPAPIERQDQPSPPPAPAPQNQHLAPPAYDPAIFQRRIPPADLADLAQDAGMPSENLWRDKQFRKLVRNNTPNVMYHFGRDMPLHDAMDTAMNDSRIPVQVRDNRYVLLGGATSMFGFHGRAFVWFDTNEGIMLGGFYFNPTNGEPSPTLSVFSKQTAESTLALSQLPPAFAQDLNEWTIQAGIPPITTRYFIDDQKKRTLLQHDEDFCAAPDGSTGPVAPDDPCEQLNENAADIDLTAAEYLEAIHYATNGTAWTASGDHSAWIQQVSATCGIGPAALPCRIRITRQRTRRILAGRP
jgi:hypothetical protein